jgi:hypothetical protein
MRATVIACSALLFVTVGVTDCYAQGWNPYDRPERQRVVSFRERDQFFSVEYKGDNLFPNYELYRSLSVEDIRVAGWFPYGTYNDGIGLNLAREYWKQNRATYEAIDRRAPTNESCLDVDYVQCVRNVSQRLIVTTELGDFRTFRQPERDINGSLKYAHGRAITYMRFPSNKKLEARKKLSITYAIETGRVEKLRIIPEDILGKLDFWRRTGLDELRSTGVYEILHAIDGGEFCNELDFYKFVVNDLVKKPKGGNDRFAASGGVISRTNVTRYESKAYCGYKFEYGYGNTEIATSRHYDSGEREWLSVTR